MPLQALVARVQDPAEARIVSGVFRVLNHLLCEIERLDVERDSAADVDKAEAATIFRAVGGKALALAGHIEACASATTADGELGAALSGVGFAIRHEVRAVFEGDVNDPAPRAPLETCKITHTHGLLRNCFQQCILLIAKAIDPMLDEASLFDDGLVRLQETLLLRDALTALIKLVGEAEQMHYPQSAVALNEEVERFRRESLGFLMRKDWATFEALAVEVLSARDHAVFKKAARRFLTYIETLLAHVQMRAVLAQHTSAPATPAAVYPFMRLVKTPAVWTTVAACVLVALVLIVAPGLRAKERSDERTAAPVERAPVETAAVASPSNVVSPSTVVSPASGAVETGATRADASAREARGHVVVQLGAYGSESVAAAQAARLRQAGVEAFVTRAQAAGVVVFRVQAGPYASRAEATLAGKRLQEKGAVQSFVVAEQG